MQKDAGRLQRLMDDDLKGLTDLGKTAAENPELVFRVGEVVKVKDGDFRIKSLGNKFMVLESLPGSRIKRKE